MLFNAQMSKWKNYWLLRSENRSCHETLLRPIRDFIYILLTVRRFIVCLLAIFQWANSSGKGLAPGMTRSCHLPLTTFHSYRRATESRCTNTNVLAGPFTPKGSGTTCPAKPCRRPRSSGRRISDSGRSRRTSRLRSRSWRRIRNSAETSMPSKIGCSLSRPQSPRRRSCCRRGRFPPGWSGSWPPEENSFSHFRFV